MAERDDIVLRLPALAESVSVARHRVRRFVRLSPEADSVMGLLVTELVGALVRAMPPSPDRRIELRLSRTPDVVRASVSSPDKWLGSPLEADGISQKLLSRLADDFGMTGDGMWVEVHARAARAA